MHIVSDGRSNDNFPERENLPMIDTCPNRVSSATSHNSSHSFENLSTDNDKLRNNGNFFCRPSAVVAALLRKG